MEDVERLFGLPLITWIKNKGYNDDATYLQVIHNWETSYLLTDEEHSKFNKEFLMYILDNLMLWYKDNGLYDFSLLEVSWKAVVGLTCGFFHQCTFLSFYSGT